MAELMGWGGCLKMMMRDGDVEQGKFDEGLV